MIKDKQEIKLTWLGYQGHFICPCNYHLTTLIQHDNKNIIISTIGRYEKPEILREEIDNTKYEQIGLNRYFETYVFEAELNGNFWEINAGKQIDGEHYVINSQNPTYDDINISEEEAHEGHYIMIEKIKKQLEDSKSA